mgnify:CR=1 FL=1
MDAIEFLNKNNILWQPCFINKLKEPDTRDNLWILNCEPKQTDWKELPLEIIKKRQKLISEVDTIVVDTNNIIHIDIDMKDINKYDQKNFDFIKQQIKNKPYYKSMSVDKGKKEGKHFFAKTDYKFSTQRPQTKYDDIELLCGQWAYLNKHQKIHIPENMEMEITDEEIKDILPPIPNTKTEIKTIKKIESKFSGDIPVSIDEDIEKIDKENLFKMIDKLNPQEFKHHKEWCSFMYFMLNQSKGEPTMEYLDKTNKFLSTLDNYDEMENMKFFMNNHNKQIGNNTSLIYKWLKRDNYEYFKEIIKSNKKEFCNDYFKTLDTYEKKKIYFEKFCWKILTGVKAIFYFYNPTLDDFKEYTEEGLKGSFKHLKHIKDGKQSKFLDIWTDDEDIKLYNDLDFIPYPLNENDTYYKYFNLYTGLRAENELKEISSTGDISKIQKHLFYLCGEDETNTDYMLDLLAHRVQYPGILPQVAVVMRSPQGSGKNIFFDWMGNYILGKKYYVCSANPESFLGRFNCGLKNKLLCVMNEVSGGDTFGKGGRLKEFITENTIDYEAKGVNKIEIRNCALLLFFTNHEQPLEIEHTDRRFVVFDCSKTTITLKKEGYFTDLVKDMKDETVQKAFYDYLMKRDIERNHDFQGKKPQTKAYLHMKEWSIPPIIKFCKWFYDNSFDKDFNNVKTKQLYDRFLDFKEETKVKSDLNSFQFTNKLKKYENIFICKRNSHKDNIMNIDQNELEGLILSYFPDY